MKNKEFSTLKIEDLSYLIFDGSINYQYLELKNGEINLPIRRRAFESVRRFKILGFTFTKVKGLKSILNLTNVKSSNLNLNQEVDSNDFILSTSFNDSTYQILIETVLGTQAFYQLSSESQVKLIDIDEDEYGKGFFKQKIGFTKREFIKEKKIQ